MAEEAENLTIRLLQELRAQQNRTDARIEEVGDRITDLIRRIDGNTRVFNLVAGAVHQHEERIDRLEQRGS
jgi:polyhydroxyalkanoate synthesis regulator phasin